MYQLMYHIYNLPNIYIMCMEMFNLNLLYELFMIVCRYEHIVGIFNSIHMLGDLRIGIGLYVRDRISSLCLLLLCNFYHTGNFIGPNYTLICTSMSQYLIMAANNFIQHMQLNYSLLHKHGELV
jgi:hypothetical protein